MAANPETIARCVRLQQWQNLGAILGMTAEKAMETHTALDVKKAVKSSESAQTEKPKTPTGPIFATPEDRLSWCATMRARMVRHGITPEMLAERIGQTKESVQQQFTPKGKTTRPFYEALQRVLPSLEALGRRPLHEKRPLPREWVVMVREAMKTERLTLTRLGMRTGYSNQSLRVFLAPSGRPSDQAIIAISEALKLPLPEGVELREAAE